MARTGSVPVALSVASDETVSVDYASEDGTAIAGTDYTAVAGTLTFTPGQVSKSIAVTAEDDAAPDGDLTFRIQLSGAVNGTLGTPSFGTVTIQQVTAAARNAVPGVTIIPAADDFVYETLPLIAKRASGSWEPHNMRAAAEDGLVTVGGGTGATTGVTNALKTDWARSLDQMDDYPNLGHCSLVVSQFGTSVDVGECRIKPLTTYKNGSVKIWDPSYNGGAGDFKDWKWIVGGLDHTSSEIGQPPEDSGAFIYGGTPSDPGVIRCIQDIRARGKRVTFYPFIMMTSSGLPWRGRITLGAPSDDMTAAAEADVATFLGNAQPEHFTPNSYWQTVYYSGPSEWSYRRMILHYAHLCVMAGGVDLFLIGSELRGLERIRGAGWTPAGTVGSDGRVTWDYPFVDGLIQLAADVRAIFDAAGLTRDTANKKNLIAYAADWSTWTGVKHNKTQGGESVSMDGIWPHLDQAMADDNIDFVCIDNYMPLTDWTSGDSAGENADIGNWNGTPPAAWPPASPGSVGLGLSGTPAFGLALAEAGIEGGQGFHYYYNNSENGTMPGGETSSNDPHNGAGLISRPQGDRLTQSRNAFYAGQELLAPKMLRWWWNNTHRAIYDAGDGNGWAPHGSPTRWEAQSKSIVYTEYGCSATMYGTNQPNVFFDPKSTESHIPWWGTVLYNAAGNPSWKPTYSVEAMSCYILAYASYWDLNNEVSAGGVSLRDTSFDALWTWDARPYPYFPDLHSVWGDWGNWQYGHWFHGKI